MEGILENFGFDPKLFVAQIVNFLLLAYIFKRFLYKPLLSVIKSREEKIQKGLLDSEAAKKILEDAENKKNEILKESQSESDKIIENARAHAAEIREESLMLAKKEAEKHISEAKNQAEIEMEKMQKQIKNMSLDAANAILKKVIESTLSPDEQNRFLSKALKDMNKN